MEYVKFVNEHIIGLKIDKSSTNYKSKGKDISHCSHLDFRNIIEQ